MKDLSVEWTRWMLVHSSLDNQRNFCRIVRNAAKIEVARRGGALLLTGTWVKSAVCQMSWPQSFFPLPLSPQMRFIATSQSRGTPQRRLCSLRLLSTASLRCWGWNVRCSSEGLAHRSKVMARSSSEKKVPQQFLCAKKSLSGDAHAFLGRTTPERQTPKLRKLNWMTIRTEARRGLRDISGMDCVFFFFPSFFFFFFTFT